MCDRLLSPLPQAVELDRGDSGLGTCIDEHLLAFMVMSMGMFMWKVPDSRSVTFCLL